MRKTKPKAAARGGSARKQTTAKRKQTATKRKQTATKRKQTRAKGKQTATKRKPTAAKRRQPATTRKQSAKKKVSRARRARKPPRARTVAVGQVVRLLAGAGTLVGRYDPLLVRAAPGHGEIRGIVCAIREVASGKLAVKTRGNMAKYVLEILQDLTFDRQYSSSQNTGVAKGAAEPAISPAWQRLQEMVREAVGRASEARPAAVLLGEEQFRQSLDGWRLVRVKAESVVTEEASG